MQISPAAAEPNLNNCPMRVAVLRNRSGRGRRVRSHFPFVAASKRLPTRSPAEYDNVTQRNKTIVVVQPDDPRNHDGFTLNGAIDSETVRRSKSPIDGAPDAYDEISLGPVFARCLPRGFPQLAQAQTCTPTNYSASDIAAAVAASPNANSILKSSSCTCGRGAWPIHFGRQSVRVKWQ